MMVEKFEDMFSGVQERFQGGARGPRSPSEISGPPVPPPQKKRVQDKAVTCQNFLLNL